MIWYVKEKESGTYHISSSSLLVRIMGYSKTLCGKRIRVAVAKTHLDSKMVLCSDCRVAQEHKHEK